MIKPFDKSDLTKEIISNKIETLIKIIWELKANNVRDDDFLINIYRKQLNGIFKLRDIVDRYSPDDYEYDEDEVNPYGQIERENGLALY